jgi:hypothetical protein
MCGISNAGKVAKQNGGEINPQQHQWRYGQGHYFDKHTGRLMTNVEFDIAVTATEDKKTKGGVAVAVASLVLGSQGESGSSNARVSRLKFSVPVILPSTREDCSKKDALTEDVGGE